MCNLFGEEAQAAPAARMAPPLAAFPSPEDASFAREVGGFYGQPTDAFPAGHYRAVSAPLHGMSTSQAADPANAAPTTSGDPAAGDFMARSALAANRIPVAGLGFDPRKINVAEAGDDRFNITGVYSPRHDHMMAAIGSNETAHNVSTPVHESIHRGLQMLRNDNPALFDGAPAGEEDMVRFIMGSMAGNPEGDAQAREVNQRGSGFAQPAQEWVDRVNAAAADAIYRKRPFGGPR